MATKKQGPSGQNQPPVFRPASAGNGHGRIVSNPEENQYLTGDQLHSLEQSFRDWAAASPRPDVRQARRRILLIFLLIRYTGAKLSEVLALDPFEDLDPGRQSVFFSSAGSDREPAPREVQISATLCREMQSALIDSDFRESLQKLFEVDPAFVRRKFYERTRACGFPQRLGGPEMIRKARAVELMQSNMPLPAVQRLLGHSTPNLTSSYVSFSEEEVRKITGFFMEREAVTKTSARNSFFGKIKSIRRGDIQSWVELATIHGHTISAVITNDSLARLGLREGILATAEVKAPWVILHQGSEEPVCSAENRCRGTISRMTKGKVNVEYVVRLAGGIELCALVATESGRRLGFKEGDTVWAVFNCFSVVLHVE
jgi:molybdate transport system regulatory protein